MQIEMHTGLYNKFNDIDVDNNCKKRGKNKSCEFLGICSTSKIFPSVVQGIPIDGPSVDHRCSTDARRHFLTWPSMDHRWHRWK